MNKEMKIEKIKNDYVIEIINCVKDHSHVFLHDKDSYNLSFHIVTAPDMLFYYGDSGTFVFQRIGQGDMLSFFKHSNIGGSPNYFYWSEKCIAGETTEYDEDTAKDSFLKIVEYEYDLEKEGTLDNRFKRLCNVIKDSEYLYDFKNAYNSLSDEYELHRVYDFFNDHNIEYFEDFNTRCNTYFFMRCLQNLAIYSSLIINKINQMQDFIEVKKKKEMRIGEIRECEGKLYKCIESGTYACSGCCSALNFNCSVNRPIGIGACNPSSREDGKSVIFVEVKNE